VVVGGAASPYGAKLSRHDRETTAGLGNKSFGSDFAGEMRQQMKALMHTVEEQVYRWYE
jgi:hypothetical protein